MAGAGARRTIPKVTTYDEVMPQLSLDGRMGEGGGQVLRTALGLALATGRGFRIHDIRGGRRKPGLLRQHLTAVRAAAAIGAARVEGAELGSSTLEFEPQGLAAGRYAFDVGSAGSAGLVLQAVLPGLLAASGRSVLEVTGGTHNRAAPPFEVLDRALLPLLRRMGAEVELTMVYPGFEPAGGGVYRLEVTGPACLGPLELVEPGVVESMHLTVWLSRLPRHIAEREVAEVRRRPGFEQVTVEILEVEATGPGNALALELGFARHAVVIAGFGARGVPAEQVAGAAAREAKGLLRSSAAVDVHLADQLLVPLALAGGGSFTTVAASSHATTNAAVIERFLPVTVRFESLAKDLWRATVSPRVG